MTNKEYKAFLFILNNHNTKQEIAENVICFINRVTSERKRGIFSSLKKKKLLNKETKLSLI